MVWESDNFRCQKMSMSCHAKAFHTVSGVANAGLISENLPGPYEVNRNFLPADG